MKRFLVLQQFYVAPYADSEEGSFEAVANFDSYEEAIEFVESQSDPDQFLIEDQNEKEEAFLEEEELYDEEDGLYLEEEDDLYDDDAGSGYEH